MTMTAHGKRDILVHFDEQTNELILYTVSVADTEQIRAREFDGARLDIPTLQGLAAEEAETTVGETILSLIDTFSFTKTGIRPYEALNEARHRRDVAQWEVEATRGDAAAQYMLHIEHHSKALFQGDMDALNSSQAMLFASAAQGYPEAVRALERWPLLRAAAEKRCRPEPSA